MNNNIFRVMPRIDVFNSEKFKVTMSYERYIGLRPGLNAYLIGGILKM